MGSEMCIRDRAKADDKKLIYREPTAIMFSRSNDSGTIGDGLFNFDVTWDEKDNPGNV